MAIATRPHCAATRPRWSGRRDPAAEEGRELVEPHERVGGTEFGRWVQAPLEGEEADWPFESDFRSDLEMLDAGEYYPSTL